MATSPQKWETLKALFDAALEMDFSARSAFLRGNCPDVEARAEVERLLNEHNQAGAFLSAPVLGNFLLEAETPTQRLSEGEVLAGRFRIVRFIAGGGMGEVYEAEDQELREQVAVKVIRPEILAQPNAVARFKREVHLARKVTHPNVCRIFDLFRHKPEGGSAQEETVFISMELLRGETLAARLKADGRMNVGQALLVRQMASALAAAHAVGIVHRDFKPGNVVLVGIPGQSEVRAVVTDFGLALQSLTSEVATVSTGQGLLGTPAYMSPEQLEGRPATTASDIYALGLVIYEMVTGARPFQGDTPISAALKRLSETPIPPRKFEPELSPAWESAILRCLERDPTQRFPNAESLAAALAGGESASESPRFVETIARRGYRFIAPLEGGSAAINAASGTVAVGTGMPQKIWLAIGAAVTFALIVAAGYGGYSFLSRWRTLPFENFTISQITNTGKVVAAAISPDGRYLLSEVDDHGKQSLWLRNIATNSDTQVIPPADAYYGSLAFSPDGNYIYFRKDNIGWVDLLRAPVLGGTPQVVVRDVDSGITFSPEGKRMAYQRMNNPEVGKFRLLTANTDGTDEKMLDSWPIHGFMGAIAWSPDGKQIALGTSGFTNALSGIRLVDTASAKEQILGRFDKDLSDFAWLPNGRGLLVTYAGNLIGHFQVGFISNPDGRFRTLTKDTNSYGGLTLSADGKTLVTVQQKSSQTLYLMPAAGFAGKPPNPALAQNKGSYYFGWASNGDLYFDGDSLLRISGDGRNRTRLLGDPNDHVLGAEGCDKGRYVLFLRAGNDASTKLSIWRVDANGSNPKQLNDRGIGADPRCSPESNWAYYFDFDDQQIKRVPIDGGVPEIVPGTVIPNVAIAGGPAISPDGKLLAFFSQKVSYIEPMKIALVDLDAGPEPPRRILEPDSRTEGRAGLELHFTPDGKAVVYPFAENGADNLWLQPLDGSRGRQITNFKSDGISSYRFSPDGKTLGVMRSQRESDVVLLRDTGSSPQ
jgi:Tol biopolymer transport system component/tRNA A-37 threonylcarbamoyl transferase component Bud32